MSWHAALGLGFLSAMFDNNTLRAGVEAGWLPYTVGFGGSLIWFGSSAAVALSNMYPDAKEARRCPFHGWAA